MTDNGDRRRAVRSFSAIAEWADAALERRGTLSNNWQVALYAIRTEATAAASELAREAAE